MAANRLVCAIFLALAVSASAQQAADKAGAAAAAAATLPLVKAVPLTAHPKADVPLANNLAAAPAHVEAAPPLAGQKVAAAPADAKTEAPLAAEVAAAPAHIEPAVPLAPKTPAGAAPGVVAAEPALKPELAAAPSATAPSVLPLTHLAEPAVDAAAPANKLPAAKQPAVPAAPALAPAAPATPAPARPAGPQRLGPAGEYTVEKGDACIDTGSGQGAMAAMVACNNARIKCKSASAVANLKAGWKAPLLKAVGAVPLTQCSKLVQGACQKAGKTAAAAMCSYELSAGSGLCTNLQFAAAHTAELGAQCVAQATSATGVNPSTSQFTVPALPAHGLFGTITRRVNGTVRAKLDSPFESPYNNPHDNPYWAYYPSPYGSPYGRYMPGPSYPSSPYYPNRPSTNPGGSTGWYRDNNWYQIGNEWYLYNQGDWYAKRDETWYMYREGRWYVHVEGTYYYTENGRYWKPNSTGSSGAWYSLPTRAGTKAPATTPRAPYGRRLLA